MALDNPEIPTLAEMRPLLLPLFACVLLHAAVGRGPLDNKTVPASAQLAGLLLDHLEALEGGAPPESATQRPFELEHPRVAEILREVAGGNADDVREKASDLLAALGIVPF